MQKILVPIETTVEIDIQLSDLEALATAAAQDEFNKHAGRVEQHARSIVQRMLEDEAMLAERLMPIVESRLADSVSLMVGGWAADYLDTAKSAAVKVVRNFLVEEGTLERIIERLVDRRIEAGFVQAMDRVYGESVDALELSVRAANCLRRAGIETIGELTQRSLTDLLRIDNLGKLTLREIEVALSKRGHRLKARS
jgi:hypothetical protein